MQQVRLGPTAVWVAGAQEAFEAFHGEVLVPEMFPIVGAGGEQLGLGGAIEAAGKFRNGEIVVCVLHGAGAGALVGQAEVAFGVVVQDAAAAFFLRIGWRNGGVFQHSFERRWGNRCRKAFDIGIGDDHIGVAAALRAASNVATASVGHIAFMAIDIDK
jgi:hypothetical protein